MDKKPITESGKDVDKEIEKAVKLATKLASGKTSTGRKQKGHY